jgi:hypothetical protein
VRELVVTVVSLVLVSAALGHARHRTLAADLAAQALIPARLRGAVVLGAPIFEVMAGGLAVVAVWESSMWTRLALVAPAVLGMGVYAAYSYALVKLRPGAPCGCSANRMPANHGVTWRAASLAVLGLAAVFAPRAPDVSAQSTALVAGVAIAVLLWSLPSSMHQPRPSVGVSA